MASHSIYMRQPKDRILNADVEFVIRENGRKLGELHISKGNVQWVSNGARKAKKIKWSKFAEIMNGI